ncbi:MAG: hypothetical protein HOP10_06700 [Chitinophagaceae bacterium]|nr:hypothetical protein [Chitinophagaceae bacterium]
MEIHHHSHTSRKKWTHYFWEFLMLFLAVFCGFLAENKREHIVEHRREKKYMITLVEDLEIDTTDMGALKRTLNEVIARRDSITQYLRPPIAAARVPQFYREAELMLNMRSYSYNGRTVEQLRSSGNYRLIRKKNITDSLIAYDIRMRGTFSKNYDALYESRLKLIELQQDILEVMIVFKYAEKNSRILNMDSLKKANLWPVHLLTTDTKTLFHHYNACTTHIGFAMDMNSWIERMTKRATNLITLIKKEYHLK